MCLSSLGAPRYFSCRHGIPRRLHWSAELALEQILELGPTLPFQLLVPIKSICLSYTH